MMISLPSLSSAIFSSFRRELVAAARNRTEIVNPLVFFVSITVFVPLGISPDSESLRAIAPGIIWIVSLLSVLLSLDKVFQSDFEDGCLEQMVLSGQSMYWLIIVKMLLRQRTGPAQLRQATLHLRLPIVLNTDRQSRPISRSCCRK